MFRPGNSSRRIVAVFVFCALAFALVLARVIVLQVSEADELRAAGLDQRTTVITIKASRGSLLDRTGQELALSVPKPTVVADPRLVVDAAGTAAMLASALQLAPAKQQALFDAFTAKTSRFEYVLRFVEPAVAEQVKAMDLPGVSIITEDERVMPSGDVGLSVVGRTDPWGVGNGGLEKQYDELLTGTDGKVLREHDRRGRSIPGTGTTTVEPVAGVDIMLTISRPLQYEVEQALLAQVAALSAKSGRVIVMDTDSGDILAEANVQRQDDGTVEVTSANLAIVEANEPGSTAKVFSIAAALDEGLITPESTQYVPDRLVFNEGSEKWEQPIRDAKPHPPMMMTVHDIVVQSSNIGTWLSTKDVPRDRYEEYLRGFGFGTKTALQLPGESNGVLAPSEEWYGSQRATITYGYGLQVTSQQLVAAVNTIANGGTYVAPRLVQRTLSSDGTIDEAPPAATRQVVSEETATTLTKMLTDVVCDPHGTGKLARLDGISVAGKTGTGYKIQENGTYVGSNGERSYFATFVGFLPADDPQVTILVSIDEPDPYSQDRFGGTAAAPTFAKVAEATIRSLGISPAPGDTGCTG